jgi:hypothetical protein
MAASSSRIGRSRSSDQRTRFPTWHFRLRAQLSFSGRLANGESATLETSIFRCPSFTVSDIQHKYLVKAGIQRASSVAGSLQAFRRNGLSAVSLLLLPNHQGNPTKNCDGGQCQTQGYGLAEENDSAQGSNDRDT